jgi:hypothetical protein
MSSEGITLLVTPTRDSVTPVLNEYLVADEEKCRARLPGPVADVSISVFQESLLRLTSRCEAFLSHTEQKQVSHLVLGKVQSGKTAHLLGTLAWACDAPIAAAVVFTGVTGSLNDQTFDRLTKDLEGLPDGPVRIIYAPTRKSARAFQRFTAEVLEHVIARSNAGQNRSPLPVIVAMKNGARVGAVEGAFELIAELLGDRACVLAIDDEADQASQNAKSRQRKVAATYAAMANIRALPLRNIWLSYTATPQAVLLTDRFGALRPNFVCTVPPRPGYFGLTDVMSPRFDHQCIEVDDFEQPANMMSTIPESLSTAILQFLFVAWVRHSHPHRFYQDALIQESFSSRMSSTQMLIHESGKQADHARMYRLVVDEVERTVDTVEKRISGDSGSAEVDLFEQSIHEICVLLAQAGAKTTGLEQAFLGAEEQIEFLSLLSRLRIMVINSDPAGPSAAEARPVSDSDYDQSPAWILVGGDILGRGITIPQLTVNYFLRSAKAPNFDTVLQQFRFCGYRQDYYPWVSIHAPEQSFVDFNYMNIVDEALWERALTWDIEERNLASEMPAVYYASSTNARFAPTRTGVRDPDLIDRSLGSDQLFSLRDVFDSEDFSSNLSHLKTWLNETDAEPSLVESAWMRFNDLTVEQSQRLLGGWAGNAKELGLLEAVAEICDPSLGELGLSEVPATLFVSVAAMRFLSQPESVTANINAITVNRKVEMPRDGASLSEWMQKYASRNHLQPSRRPILKVPHVGGGQRKVKDLVHYNSVIYLIEPIRGMAVSKDPNSVVAVGLGLSAFSPDNFEVRVIGHR